MATKPHTPFLLQFPTPALTPVHLHLPRPAPRPPLPPLLIQPPPPLTRTIAPARQAAPPSNLILLPLEHHQLKSAPGPRPAFAGENSATCVLGGCRSEELLGYDAVEADEHEWRVLRSGRGGDSGGGGVGVGVRGARTLA